MLQDKNTSYAPVIISKRSPGIKRDMLEPMHAQPNPKNSLLFSYKLLISSR